MKSNALATLACVLWGLAMAYGLRELILWQQPHWALKYFLGYGIGGYLAFINYGLFRKDTIPPEAYVRHLIIELVPFITFVVASVLIAFVLR